MIAVADYRKCIYTLQNNNDNCDQINVNCDELKSVITKKK